MFDLEKIEVSNNIVFTYKWNCQEMCVTYWIFKLYFYYTIVVYDIIWGKSSHLLHDIVVPNMMQLSADITFWTTLIDEKLFLILRL